MVTVAAAVARRRFKAAESWPTGAVRGGVGERWAVSSVGQQSKRRCLSVRVCYRSRARARSLSRSLSRALSLSPSLSPLSFSLSALASSFHIDPRRCRTGPRRNRRDLANAVNRAATGRLRAGPARQLSDATAAPRCSLWQRALVERRDLCRCRAGRLPWHSSRLPPPMAIG